MRLIKCRNCGNKKPKNEIYQIIHTTKGGKEEKRNYCNEQCYLDEQNEIYMLKQCQYFVDDVFGYVCVNNEKNKQIKEITDAGYSRQELYDCMLELKQQIQEGLGYRQDIEKEVNRIRYMFAIIKANIKEITDRNKINTKQDTYCEDEYIAPIITTKKLNTRVGLNDIFGGE